jgi:hypothetical protein
VKEIAMKETKDADGGDRAPFHDGGSTPMHGNVGTGPQQPGKSSQEGGHAGKDPGAKVSGGPASGGFYASGATNKDYAGSQKEGTSAASKSGGNSKFAEGGKTPMHSNRGSVPAQAGKSSAY